MLYPSVDSLMKNIDSKYTLVTVAAKRARDIQEGSEVRLVKPVSKKYVGMALEEIKDRQLEFERKM